MGQRSFYYTVADALYYGNIILGIIIILMGTFGGISLIMFSINTNQIILIIMFVVRSIFTFVLYYMGRDVANETFKLLKLVFLRLIIFILSSYGMLIFIR